MAPEDYRAPGRRRSMLGVAAYLLVPGERRRRAAGHFGRAAVEAARGMRTLYIPARSEVDRTHGTHEMIPADRKSGADRGGSGNRPGGRQRIEID